jgi:DHA1 family bicyclomycin/chloramphenicol resistance-like MFS transporter
MGVLNGSVGVAMAFAPVLGSYINLSYGWRGNFAILLALSITCLGLGWIYLPKGIGNPHVALSLKEYAPVIRSKKAFYYILSMVFLLQSYWIFIGISPIYYMESLGVSLETFGFYQGALAASFALISLTSGLYLRLFGQKRCFFFGVILLVAFIAAMPIMVLLPIKDPLIITLIMVVESIGVIFPINILWPLMLESIPGARGRITAVAIAARLIVTAFSLQLVSFFYDGTGRSLGTFMGIYALLTLWIGYKLFQIDPVFAKKDVTLTEDHPVLFS